MRTEAVDETAAAGHTKAGHTIVAVVGAVPAAVGETPAAAAASDRHRSPHFVEGR